MVSESRQTLSERARQRYDRAVEVLELAVPLARGVLTAVVLYASVVAASGFVILTAVVAQDPPGTWYTWFGTAMLAVALAAAPAVLLFFASLLREVVSLPAKLRALPDVGPAHARELAQLMRAARAEGRQVRLRTLPRDLIRLGRLLLRLHDDIPTAGVLLALVRIPMLVAVGFAFVAGFFEVILAPVVVLSVLAARTL